MAAMMPSKSGSKLSILPIILLVATTYPSLVASDDEVRVPLAADRIRNEPQSVWIEFIQLALDHKPLNLGQGFPDFAAPKYLVESLETATRLSSPTNVLNHQYTRSFGHPRLVRALQAYYNKLRGFEQLIDDKEQVLVTVGAYEALFTAVMAFVGPGDEVLVVDPAFDAYAPMVAMAGGESVFVPLRLSRDGKEPNNQTLSSKHYKLDMNELKEMVNHKTRAIILNTPNNPMGKIYSRHELNELASICKQNNLLVIADEVYEQFFYDSEQHVSIASLPGMWQRTVTIGSAGKTFSVTGWKIGWAYGPAYLIRYMQLVHQTAVYTVATPLQEAVAKALEHEMLLIEDPSKSGETQASSESGGDETSLYWSSLRADLLKKRNRMAEVLERAQMRPIVPQGGYFMMADFSNLAKLFPEYAQMGHVGRGNESSSSSSPINTNDYKFARWLSKVKHLQGIPGGAFYSHENKSLGKDLIRLCFIKRDETLKKFEKLIDELIKGRV